MCNDFKKLVKGPGKPARDSKCATCGVTWTEHPRQTPEASPNKTPEAAFGAAAAASPNKTPEAGAGAKTCPKCFFAYVNEHICGNPFAASAATEKAAPKAPSFSFSTPAAASSSAAGNVVSDAYTKDMYRNTTGNVSNTANVSSHNTPNVSGVKSNSQEVGNETGRGCASYQRSIVARGRIGFTNPCKNCGVVYGEHRKAEQAEQVPTEPKPTEPKPTEPTPSTTGTTGEDCGEFRRTVVARGRVPFAQACANCGVQYGDHGVWEKEEKAGFSFVAEPVLPVVPARTKEEIEEARRNLAALVLEMRTAGQLSNWEELDPTFVQYDCGCILHGSVWGYCRVHGEAMESLRSFGYLYLLRKAV